MIFMYMMETVELKSYNVVDAVCFPSFRAPQTRLVSVIYRWIFLEEAAGFMQVQCNHVSSEGNLGSGC